MMPILTAVISHASKVMLKILQARFQQYMNCELPDVQAGFRKDRRTRDKIAISWIMEKAREFQKNIYPLVDTVELPNLTAISDGMVKRQKRRHEWRNKI